MIKKKFIYILSVSVILYLLPEIFFHNAMLYIVGGLVGGFLKELLAISGSTPNDTSVFLAWSILLIGSLFLYYRIQLRPLKYLNICFIFPLLYLFDFIIAEMLPENIQGYYLITGINVITKSIALSLIIFFLKNKKHESTN